jgi:hypothetical protein
MNKIVVCQYWTKNLSYGQYTEAINKKYCEEQGYVYHNEVDTDKIFANLDGRAITWYKPKFILEVLETHNPDFILFLDADAIVCDSSYRIEEFIDDNYNIICTEDYGPSKLNAGVFIMKNTEWTKNFLQKWWDICDELTGGEQNQKGYYANALWHDQTCFGHLMSALPDAIQNIKLISNKVLNGRDYKNSVDKNFIFHAFSYGMINNRTIDNAYYDIFNVTKPTGKELIDVVQYYNTDKHHEHNYFNLIYSELFKNNYKDVKKFIEIGVLDGGSVELWRDYFVNAEIIALDYNIQNTINKLSGKNLDRITFQSIDQSDPIQLEELTTQYSDVDVIMDDGSHRMYDQQITLAKTFKMLKSEGIYVLEDLHTSLEAGKPEKAWCGWGDSTKTITLDMLNEFNMTGKIKSDYMTEEECDYLTNNIKSIDVYRNRADWSITSVIIKK